MWGKKWMEISAIKEGGRRSMANAINIFHFVFFYSSLISLELQQLWWLLCQFIHPETSRLPPFASVIQCNPGQIPLTSPELARIWS